MNSTKNHTLRYIKKLNLYDPSILVALVFQIFAYIYFIIIIIIIIIIIVNIIIKYYYNYNYNQGYETLVRTESYNNIIKCPSCRLIQNTTCISLYFRYIKDEYCPICLQEEKWFIQCNRSTAHILCCTDCYKPFSKKFILKKMCKWCNNYTEYIEPRIDSNKLFYAWCGKC